MFAKEDRSQFEGNKELLEKLFAGNDDYTMSRNYKIGGEEIKLMEKFYADDDNENSDMKPSTGNFWQPESFC